MDTGLFDLLKTVSQPEAIVQFLDRSSYDELIEIDLEKQIFKRVFHIAKKYSITIIAFRIFKYIDLIYF